MSISFEAVPPPPPAEPVTLFESSLRFLLEAGYERIDVVVAGRSYVMLADSDTHGRASSMGPLVTIEQRGEYGVAADHIAGRTFTDVGDTAARDRLVREELRLDR